MEGPPDAAAAFLSVSTLGHEARAYPLQIAPNWVAIEPSIHREKWAVDMTAEHTLTIRHRDGLLNVQVDGETLFSKCIFRESPRLSDFHGGDPARRTQFGQSGDVGASFWRRVSYQVKNRSLPDVGWVWDASDGKLPDEYQRERMIQVHANHPHQMPWPDHGYSSWVQLPDGRVFLVDYTNCGDEPNRSHLVGVYIEPEDIE